MGIGSAARRHSRTALLVVAFGLTSAAGIGQVTRPLSLEATRGVNVRAHDGRLHKDSSYYNALCRVVLQEFDLPADYLPPVDLVFVDREMQARLTSENAGRFPSPDWTGAFIRPSLIIMVGEEEADDTFMHEFMHVLQQHGKLFQDVPFSAVHRLIDQNEGLLLGSKSYLDFLKEKHR